MSGLERLQVRRNIVKKPFRCYHGIKEADMGCCCCWERTCVSCYLWDWWQFNSASRGVVAHVFMRVCMYVRRVCAKQVALQEGWRYCVFCRRYRQKKNLLCHLICKYANALWLAETCERWRRCSVRCWLRRHRRRRWQMREENIFWNFWNSKLFCCNGFKWCRAGLVEIARAGYIASMSFLVCIFVDE